MDLLMVTFGRGRRWPRVLGSDAAVTARFDLGTYVTERQSFLKIEVSEVVDRDLSMINSATTTQMLGDAHITEPRP